MVSVSKHADIPAEVRGPGVTRKITVDKSTGSGAITAGVVYLEPGGTIPPHTHLVEEAMTLVEGKLKILVGTETDEVEAPVYSHLTYDVVPDQPVEVKRPDIVVIEGLNVLQPARVREDGRTGLAVSDFFDFSIYVDAATSDIRR